MKRKNFLRCIFLFLALVFISSQRLTSRSRALLSAFHEFEKLRSDLNSIRKSEFKTSAQFKKREARTRKSIQARIDVLLSDVYSASIPSC